MEKEFVFSNLGSLVNEKNNISPDFEDNKWRIMEYSTGKYKGEMLITTEAGLPEDISVDLNLEGIYQIYICVPRLRAANYLNVKLSGDLCFTGLMASDKAPKNWMTEEYVEELYWKTADLTGQKIVFSKADSIITSATGVAWVRCVPVDKMPPAITNKCVQMHNDEDVAAQDMQKSDDDYLMKVYPIANTNAEFVSFEFSFDYDGVPDPGKAHLLGYDTRWDEGNYRYREKADTIYKKAVDFAHKNGFGIYAANRMCVSNFVVPYTRFGWNSNFVENNHQFYIKTRIGETVRVCSYAYDEVQDYVISNFVNMLKYGFDGITLIMHRGIHIGFDQPVIDRFKELYPDVDPCTLPFSDERLHGVWCEFMNKFMRKLRNAVGKDIRINTITDYGMTTSKHLGLDVEYWAKNGLIDSAAHADMEIFENLEGCMSDDNPGLIDLEKYKKELTERHVVTRKFGCNVDKVCENIPAFEKLRELYGIDVYHVLPWVGRKLPEEYPGIIERMEKAGAKKFLSWNTNHLMRDLPEWYTVSHIGNEPEDVELRKFYRVITLDGNYIAEFQPNWRG